MSDPITGGSGWWKWAVCGLLLLATMLNYMDRQTLAQTGLQIRTEYNLSHEQYGILETGFGLAFAVGSLASGFLADRMSVRWLYPVVLIGWSLAGLATALAAPLGAAIHWALPSGCDLSWIGIEPKTHPAFLGLLTCRTVLGFFEAGQWPCALVTSQRILSPQERALGNGLLQSGASLGAILTPLVVQLVVTDRPGGWQGPFVLIGACGLAWIWPWLALVRRNDLTRRGEDTAHPQPAANVIDSAASPAGAGQLRCFLALAVTVVLINVNWQFLRAWLPMFLGESHHYEPSGVNWITSAYFFAAGIGSLCAGAAARGLVAGGWSVHRSRMIPFTICAVLVALSTIVAGLERGPLLLGLLFVIGFGALGVFPAYYSLTQELSLRHQGKITGVLSAATWVAWAVVSPIVGQRIDTTKSYADGIFWIGLAPAAACVVLWLAWGRGPTRTATATGDAS